MKRKTVYILGWVTLLGFGGGGLVLCYFFNNACPLELLSSGSELYIQIPLGLLYGFLSALAVIFIMRHPVMTREEARYKDMLGPLNLRWRDIIFLSFCAGFGEEMFFRAFLQPHTGIWLGSVIFVVLHGYLNPKRPIFFYGLFLVFDIAGMGWLFDNIGPWSAVSAHFLIDVILLAHLGEAEDFEEESLIRSEFPENF